ncbi:hypothetical protein GCM10018790_10670 [Kitasatospora xanthocidica]|uniref:hypothetical protein n=1 Tax=Kitasatospora xanthocidica TaxID=83382 RepID=UPI00167C13D6|nr:hypothetical protein [Kitasatospora xanthocidica]GHF34828.1 hypothetical protein GCM10018790_10670 [Kitasatospora xanthocidica]
MTATTVTTATTGPAAAPTPEALLDAGAVLPVGTLPGAGRPDGVADVLTARGYTHPALDGRRIVRLVPGALGRAEDLAVDFLGLAPDSDPSEVGQVRQEALGFPAWALVHDPANGHHALALVKEMERLARQAAGKPGAAKDGFDALVTRLGRAVPHFLPTFCEEVGRIFLGHGNQTYAAAWFGKAREAERTHGLTVDEERLRAVFLEFALAGALTVKSLRQYVKELAQRLDPLTAWQRFRQLCTERSAAGMAPYAGVAEDARALIRAAGLDRTEHEHALLAELLAAPAVNRAPAAFWKSWHGALIELGRNDAGVRTRLLELLPDPAASDSSPHDTAWLEVLAGTGAEELLTGPRAEGAEPAAAWLQRWCHHLGRGWRSRPSCPATLALAGRMTERLRADAVPVDLFTGIRASHTRLDLLDLLLAAGVPVADPPPGLGFDLRDWVGQSGPDNAGLAAVAADTRYRPLLRRAAPAAWETAVKRQAAVLPLLDELFAEWAEERAGEVTAARGLAGAADLVRSLSQHRTAIRTVAPAAAEKIAALDVTGLLARALTTGILDELGWPALEDALAALADPPADDAPPVTAPGLRTRGLTGLIVEDAWPYLILARLDRAVVVGPQGVLLEHTLRLPKLTENWNRPRLRLVDGELLVAWYEDGKQTAYWSGRPGETFELEGGTIAGYHYGERFPEAPSLPLPGGGRTTGERPLHPGDTRMPHEHPVLGDGTGYWTLRHGTDGPVLRELDPATGTLGRAAEPPVIAATAAAGRLLEGSTRLLPLQPGLERTPLGTDGTVLGHWVRSDPGRAVTAFTADGQRIVLPLDGRREPDTLPVGRLALPGEAGPVVSRPGGEHLSLNLPDLADRADRTADLRPCRSGDLSAAGTALVPPYDHWHALRPRDEAGSRVLRELTTEQAAGLIDLAWPVDATPVPEDEQRWLTVQGVRRPLAQRGEARNTLPVEEVGGALSGIAHPLLLAGVAGLARAAADLLDRVARFVPQPDAERPTKAEAAEWRPEHGRDDELRDAVVAVLPHTGGFGSSWGSSDRCWVLNNLRAVTAALAAPPAAGGDGWSTPTTLTLQGGDANHGWLHLLGRIDVLAHAVAAPLTRPGHRSSLVLLLGELTKGPLADRGATLREIVLAEAPQGATSDRPATHRQGEVLRHGDRTVVILGHRRQFTDGTVHWLAVDHDPSGEFGPVAHFTTVEERSTEERVTAAWTAEFRRVAALHDGLPWDAARAAAFSELTGIGTARATLLLSPPSGLLHWGNAELPAEYGYKPAEVRAARAWLRGHEHAGLAEVWGALLPADPKTLWTEGPDLTAGAEAWIRRFGRLVTLPEEALTTVQGVSIDTIEAVLNPGHTPWLTRTTGFRLSREHLAAPRLVPEDLTAVPESGALDRAVDALRWLAYHLPVDSPLRPLLRPAAAALRERLADPELLLDLGLLHTPKGAPVSAVLRTHFGLPAQGGADPDGLVRCGPALVLSPDHEEYERIWLRPAALTGPDDPLLELLGGLTDSYGFALERTAVAAVLGGEPERLADSAATVTADGAGDGPAWLQNPLVSTPGLVAEVARTHDLGEDAATLYLQLLALPDPTDRNAARWTGWKPARLKRARAELAATGLVLEAKRSRAGRSLFLPGGWQEAKSPALPAETWKAGLYELSAYQPVLAHLPVPELFARAWQRTLDGDAPGYEELQTGKRRKARR